MQIRMKGKCSNCKVCKAYLKSADKDQTRHVLSICWRRDFIEHGRPENRLTLTENDIHNAVKDLKNTLAPLGVNVVLKISAPVTADLPQKRSPLTGIWIAGRQVEEWLYPTNQECRTSPNAQTDEYAPVFVKKTTTVSITAEAIVKAGLLAAKQLMQTGAAGGDCPVS